MDMNLKLFLILAIFLLISVSLSIYKACFKYLNCSERTSNGKLTGQLKHGISCALLPGKKGLNRYKLIVNKGNIRLVHHSYNPDGGTWSLSPHHEHKEYMDMKAAGTYTYILELDASFGKLDRLE